MDGAGAGASAGSGGAEDQHRDDEISTAEQVRDAVAVKGLERFSFSDAVLEVREELVRADDMR